MLTPIHDSFYNNHVSSIRAYPANTSEGKGRIVFRVNEVDIDLMDLINYLKQYHSDWLVQTVL